MARSAEDKRLVKKLIQSITGFEETDENFHICRNFVHSNLKFHRYLDTDRYKVERTLEGLYTKLKVHSQTDNAAGLEDRVNSFLTAPVYERNLPKTHTHYAVLQFLLELSTSPQTVKWQPTEHPTETNQIDTFDWFSYLTKDYEPILTDFPDSDTEFDWDSRSEPEVSAVAPARETATSEAQLIQESLSKISTAAQRLLTPQYWRGEQQGNLVASERLAKQWHTQTDAENDRISHPQTLYLTEYQVVRELLWVLTGAPSSFLCTFDTGTSRYVINPEISLTHSTKESLTSLLSPHLSLASRLTELRAFDPVTSDPADSPPDEPASSQTLQAFRCGVRHVVNRVDAEINALIERSKPEEQAQIATLLQLSDSLSSLDTLTLHIYRIHTLTELHIRTQGLTSPATRATCLLAQCEAVLNDLCVQGLPHPQIKLVHQLYLQTLSPYLNMIDCWLSRGILEDPFTEFIYKKKLQASLDQSFWDQSVVLETTSCSILDNSVLDWSAGAASQPITNNLIPPILQPILSMVTTVGKSVEMLSRLGCLRQIVKHHDKSLIEELTDRLCTNPASITDASAASGALVEPGETQTIDSSNRESPQNKLLEAYFSSSADSELPTRSAVERLRSAPVSLGYQPSAVGLCRRMAQCLKLIMRERYEHVTKSLLEILKEKCQLFHHLNLIQKVYLMEVGDDHYTALFDKIGYDEDWREEWVLTSSLRFGLEFDFPDDISNLSICLTEGRRELLVDCLAQIHIHYEVKWPIDVVFDAQLDEAFNQIHQFLLQVKFAKHLSNHLRFSDIERPDREIDGVSRTELYLLRTRLMHFINGLYEYTIRNIIGNATLDLNRSLSSAHDLDKVIFSCRRFVKVVSNQCFLRTNQSVIRDNILKLLNAAVKFHRIWRNVAVDVRVEGIRKIETEFTNSLTLLSSFMAALSRSGSKPHTVEYLYSILQTSLTHSTSRVQSA